MPIQFRDSTAFGEVSTERTLTNIDRTRTDSVLEIVLKGRDKGVQVPSTNKNSDCIYY